VCRLDSSCSEWEGVANYCEDKKELSGSVNIGNYVFGLENVCS
jgi:hypothetical protein